MERRHSEIGYEWRPQLEQAIERSQLALLLVSRPFLASKFIMGRELPALIERGVRLVPVLVRDCLWEQEPLLEPLQWGSPRVLPATTRARLLRRPRIGRVPARSVEKARKLVHQNADLAA